jgi:hypothetical protein
MWNMEQNLMTNYPRGRPAVWCILILAAAFLIVAASGAKSRMLTECVQQNASAFRGNPAIVEKLAEICVDELIEGLAVCALDNRIEAHACEHRAYFLMGYAAGYLRLDATKPSGSARGQRHRP